MSEDIVVDMDALRDTNPVIEDLAISRIATCPPEIIKAKIAIMKAVHGVDQTGRNKFHNYDYASSADVLKSVREAMVDNGLALEMWPVEFAKDEDDNMRVKFMMQWQHESGAVAEPLPWYGIANDRDKGGKTMDKWFNKCATAAEKYFFLKQFHIPSEKGFDPDEGNAATDKDNSNRKSAAALKKEGAWEAHIELIERHTDADELDAFMNDELLPGINDIWPKKWIADIREYAGKKWKDLKAAAPIEQQLGHSDDNGAALDELDSAPVDDEIRY